MLRLAIAHGEQLDRDRAIELAGVVGAGFGFRAIARKLLDFVPFAGWAVKGAIAYTGTRAIGETARQVLRRPIGSDAVRSRSYALGNRTGGDAA